MSDRTLTQNLKTVLPHISNPGNLTDAELEAAGVVRAVVEQPTVEWWQRRGARIDDIDQRPAHVTWAVEDRMLAEVKEIAWAKTKSERVERRTAGVARTFPDGSTGHIQIRDEDIVNLLSIHAKATTATAAGSAEPIPFTDREDVTRWLAPADALAVAMAAFAHGAAVHVTSQDIRAAILAAETVAEVVTAAQWPGD